MVEAGEPIVEVARGLGIYDGTVGGWVNAWRRAHPELEKFLCPVGRA